jgi:FkbM family methyltransferase
MIDFEARLEAFYRRLPLEGSAVIDVGAHLGRHAIPLAQLVGPSGIVHAFEPIPVIRSRLAENLRQADANNVIVYPFPLANEAGPTSFTYTPDLPQESGIKARHIYNEPTGEPELLNLYARRLDDLFQKPEIAFIKIDIEGGELDMLRGATESISAARPIVSFECGASSFLGYHDEPEAIFDLFSVRDYVVCSIIGDEVTDRQAFREASHAQTVWDYIALPREKAHLADCLKASVTV